MRLRSGRCQPRPASTGLRRVAHTRGGLVCERVFEQQLGAKEVAAAGVRRAEPRRRGPRWWLFEVTEDWIGLGLRWPSLRIKLEASLLHLPPTLIRIYFVYWKLMNVKCIYSLLCLGCLFGMQVSLTHSLTHSLNGVQSKGVIQRIMLTIVDSIVAVGTSHLLGVILAMAMTSALLVPSATFGKACLVTASLARASLTLHINVTNTKALTTQT